MTFEEKFFYLKQERSPFELDKSKKNLEHSYLKSHFSDLKQERCGFDLEHSRLKQE
ncbi:MAG: hypothetical protein H7Z11_09760 [Verrucomicrobia bacterium]|nr:hypothetical protein [Leptolyngbya sp. ES-bin-22]